MPIFMNHAWKQASWTLHLGCKHASSWIVPSYSTIEKTSDREADHKNEHLKGVATSNAAASFAIFAGASGEKCFVHYEQGGRGISI